jgi:hypothetical protein
VSRKRGTVGCHMGGGERGRDEDSTDWSNTRRLAILRCGVL